MSSMVGERPEINYPDGRDTIAALIEGNPAGTARLLADIDNPAIRPMTRREVLALDAVNRRGHIRSEAVATLLVAPFVGAAATLTLAVHGGPAVLAAAITCGTGLAGVFVARSETRRGDR